MEVSAVPSNPDYPEGGDYGNRGPNVSYAPAANDPRGDYYSAPPRGHNYGYAQRQYQPHEREFVASYGSCSHCQTHCCQTPVEYQNQPAGSRGERLERYVGTVANEPAPITTRGVPEVEPEPSRTGKGVPYEPCMSQVEVPPTGHEGSVQTLPSHNQTVEQPVERTPHSHDIACSAHHPEQVCRNDSYGHKTASGPPSRDACSMESPFVAEERRIEPKDPAIPQSRSSEPYIAKNDSTPSCPAPSPAQSLPTMASRNTVHDSVATLMIPSKPSQPRNSSEEESQKFKPSLLTHLNFKEKQLAMSAVKKAAANMSCISMFQEKDKQNCGKIGRRDFQIVMDRIGVLRGMSSREIDAVFKGFATQTDTEIDYKKFSAACRHAVDNDYRLARMAQK